MEVVCATVTSVLAMPTRASAERLCAPRERARQTRWPPGQLGLAMACDLLCYSAARRADNYLDCSESLAAAADAKAALLYARV
jgi:hypothetical protein